MGKIVEIEDTFRLSAKGFQLRLDVCCVFDPTQGMWDISSQIGG